MTITYSSKHTLILLALSFFLTSGNLCGFQIILFACVLPAYLLKSPDKNSFAQTLHSSLGGSGHVLTAGFQDCNMAKMGVSAILAGICLGYFNIDIAITHAIILLGFFLMILGLIPALGQHSAGSYVSLTALAFLSIGVLTTSATLAVRFFDPATMYYCYPFRDDPVLYERCSYGLKDHMAQQLNMPLLSQTEFHNRSLKRFQETPSTSYFAFSSETSLKPTLNSFFPEGFERVTDFLNLASPFFLHFMVCLGVISFFSYNVIRHFFVNAVTKAAIASNSKEVEMDDLKLDFGVQPSMFLMFAVNFNRGPSSVCYLFYLFTLFAGLMHSSSQLFYATSVFGLASTAFYALTVFYAKEILKTESAAARTSSSDITDALKFPYDNTVKYLHTAFYLAFALGAVADLACIPNVLSGVLHFGLLIAALSMVIRSNKDKPYTGMYHHLFISMHALVLSFTWPSCVLFVIYVLYSYHHEDAKTPPLGGFCSLGAPIAHMVKGDVTVS